jgi:hypothetical protein
LDAGFDTSTTWQDYGSEAFQALLVDFVNTRVITPNKKPGFFLEIKPPGHGAFENPQYFLIEVLASSSSRIVPMLMKRE